MKFLSEVDRLGEILKDVPVGNFSAEATRLLKNVAFQRLFSQNIVPELRKRHSENAPLLDHDCNFSDECLVLYVGPDYTIELYHWLYSDTGIHDHNFQGAFQCLEGEDHQIEFHFKTERKVFEGLEAGRLLEVSNHVIVPGETQEIRNQDHFIHAVAHSPSTWNLTVRTKGDSSQVLKAYHTEGYRYALRKDREEKLRETELSEIKTEELSSTDLLHLFHMLGTKSGHHDIRRNIDCLLNERHTISYLSMMEATSRFLNELGRVAKKY